LGAEQPGFGPTLWISAADDLIEIFVVWTWVVFGGNGWGNGDAIAFAMARRALGCNDIGTAYQHRLVCAGR
jgi:hypothetical protein